VAVPEGEAQEVAAEEVAAEAPVEGEIEEVAAAAEEKQNPGRPMNRAMQWKAGRKTPPPNQNSDQDSLALVA